MMEPPNEASLRWRRGIPQYNLSRVLLEIETCLKKVDGWFGTEKKLVRKKDNDSLS